MGLPRYNKILLQNIANECDSYSDMVRALSLKTNGGSVSYISKMCKKHNVNTSHFTHLKRTKEYTKRQLKLAHGSVLFTKKRNYRISGTLLRRALLRIGRAYICEKCGIGNSYNGDSLVLEVDHVDGQATNNNKDNLRFLCPNCHSQTATYRSKNKSNTP